MDNAINNRREFFRYGYEKPVHYTQVSLAEDRSIASKLIDAVSKNLSASGILFTSRYMPEISSILALDLDYRTTSICKEIEGRVLILNDKLFGKVVRIEDADNGLYDVGVAFIKKSEELAKDIKVIIKDGK